MSKATEANLEITPAEFNPAVHDATITAVSPNSGEHRTFRIETVRGGGLDGKRVVSMLVGPDNETSYKGFGFVMDDGRVAVWHRLRGDGTREGRSQWERFAALIEDPAYWETRGVQYLFALHCRRCGRQLTHPDSIEDGLGPVCRDKV